MKKWKECMLLGLVCIGVSTVGVTASAMEYPVMEGGKTLNLNDPEPRKTENVGGGTWEHGFKSYYVYLAYSHNSKRHGATALNGFGEGKRVIKKAGVKALSQVNFTLAGNRVYCLR